MSNSTLKTELDEYTEMLGTVKNVIDKEQEKLNELMKRIKSTDIATLKTTTIVSITEEVLSFKKKYIDQVTLDDNTVSC